MAKGGGDWLDPQFYTELGGEGLPGPRRATLFPGLERDPIGEG